MIKSKRKTITGELINFRGLIWAPVNEQGVVFLFGMVARELGMYVEVVRPGYPDCIAKRYIGKGRWEEVRIEFEYRSGHFKHDPSECDMIVCWEHDWSECPRSIEVIELKEEIKRLENFPLEPPDKPTTEEKYSLKMHLDRAGGETKRLFEELDKKIRRIDDAIYFKVAKYRLMYYSPKRTFAAVALRKGFLNIHLFTNGKRLKGVEPFSGDYGYKWGRIYVRSRTDLPNAISVLKRSHQMINQCIKANIPTGWYAEIE
jgi:predicted transport protein